MKNPIPALREFVEWLLLPALAAVLPWRVYFRVLRRISAWNWLLREEVARAVRGHQAFCGRPPDARWRQRHRLTILVDRADAWLSATRGDGWLERYLERDGDWPTGAFLAVTFHYGNGLWAMRDLRRRGQPVSMVSIRFSAASFAGRRIPYFAARQRFREVARAGGAPVIFTGGSVPVIRTTLATGRCVLGLIDVPPGQAGGSLPVRFLDRDMLLPSGMLRIAAEAGIPVAGFTLDFDWNSGIRRLRIRTVPSAAIGEQAAFLAAMLDRALTDGSPAWQLWSCAPEFLAPSAEAA
ncbi:MAG: hypothetical protein KDG52_00850 [Rhodocyclaceae bacterium]|nr:hypothetical protein [Rhodocyclaceae bacterium]